MLRNVPVAVAAAVMGKGPQFIRIGIQRGLLPIGEALKVNESNKRGRYNYYISPRLLRKYTGCTTGDIMSQMKRYGFLEKEGDCDAYPEGNAAQS